MSSGCFQLGSGSALQACVHHRADSRVSVGTLRASSSSRRCAASAARAGAVRRPRRSLRRGPPGSREVDWDVGAIGFQNSVHRDTARGVFGEQNKPSRLGSHPASMSSRAGRRVLASSRLAVGQRRVARTTRGLVAQRVAVGGEVVLKQLGRRHCSPLQAPRQRSEFLTRGWKIDENGTEACEMKASDSAPTLEGSSRRDAGTWSGILDGCSQ